MKSKKIKLLFIDDEQHNLDALRASYRREWEIYTATNGVDADRILSEFDISVILSDHMMPVKTGVELLEEYAIKYPHVSRILITAHAETPLIAKAINKGKINYFLEKPWNNETLRQAVTSCHNISLMSKELKEKNELLAKAYDDLSRFIYSASHEMRSPLMSILGMIELAKEDKDINSIFEYHELMVKSVKDVDTFIQGIIEYYNNSKTEIEPQNINFEDLINEALEEYVDDENSKFNVIMQYENGSENFMCDPYKLKIVLGNLFHSASETCKKLEVETDIDIKINVSPIEAKIEINEKESSILYSFIQNVFKFFFSSSNYRNTTTESNVMSLFLFKDSLLKLNGNINIANNNNTTTYTIQIPSSNE